MKIFSLCFALVLAGANLAHAQTAAAPAAAPAGLYAALGEKAGIDRLADDFVERLLRHPRIGPQFKDTKPAAFKESLAEQFCAAERRPLQLPGCRHARTARRPGHQQGRFQRPGGGAAARHGRARHPLFQQNRLLALLAPMHRDVITVH
jgi:hemoglobin